MAQAVGAKRPVLYVSGEESAAQVALRAQRLGGDYDNVQVATETDLDSVLALAQVQDKRSPPALLVIDSIQTMASASVPNAAGSVTQLRECTAALVRHAKATGVAVLIDGGGQITLGRMHPIKCAAIAIDGDVDDTDVQATVGDRRRTGRGLPVASAGRHAR